MPTDVCRVSEGDLVVFIVMVFIVMKQLGTLVRKFFSHCSIV